MINRNLNNINKVLVLTLVIFVGFTVTACNLNFWKKDITEDKTQQNKDITDTMEDTIQGKIGNLTLGDNIFCQYVQEEDGMKIYTEAYISGKNKSRVTNTVVKNDGTKETSEAIMKDNTVYSWTNSLKQGFKMNLDDVEETAENINVDTSIVNTLEEIQKEDFSAEGLKYKCESWKVDESKFDVPTDIEFIDYKQMMESLKNGFEDILKSN